MAIPRIIHYCWFGNHSMSELEKRCLNSWREKCPDYEIRKWDEDSFDLEASPFASEAHKNQMWAFVSDYVRLFVLYKYGGIYMDTDVEVIGSLDDYLGENAFSGFEDEDNAVTCIIGSEAGHMMIHKLLQYYEGRHFVLKDGSMDITPNTEIITSIAKDEGLILNNKKQTVSGMTFFPSDFFCPKSHRTGVTSITNNTACIHHFSGSWLTDEQRGRVEISRALERKYGKDAGHLLFLLYKYLLHPDRIVKRIVHGRNSTR